jgi:serine/threonine protein kinase
VSTLYSGDRLGPYEILSAVGAGGMGEVYRATDTNLKRQVAIKILPASVATDVERVTRFQREAEVMVPDATRFLAWRMLADANRRPSITLMLNRRR